jgi:hypothetical protein
MRGNLIVFDFTNMDGTETLRPLLSDQLVWGDRLCNSRDPTDEVTRSSRERVPLVFPVSDVAGRSTWLVLWKGALDHC